MSNKIVKLVCLNLLLLAGLVIPSVAQAARLELALSGLRSDVTRVSKFVFINTNNTAIKASRRDNNASITVNSNSGTLAMVNGVGKLSGIIVAAIRYDSRFYTVPEALELGICNNSSARAVTWFTDLSALTSPLSLSLVMKNGYGYLSALPSYSHLALSTSRLAKVGKTTCLPLGVGRLGARRVVAVAALDTVGAMIDPNDVDGDGTANASDQDDDGDGFIDTVDVDNDNDGKLDGDDTNNSDRTDGELTNTFWMFSNFHRNLIDSFNVNAMSVTASMVNAALAASGGLAIQVIGNGEREVELDCGALNYCRFGGTGRAREPYPNGTKFPEELDDDEDLKGSIFPGESGDFQLGHYATASQIKAGDILIQEVKGVDNKIRRFIGMLNFVFHTTPAVKQVVVGGVTTDFSYPIAAGARGTPGNCIEVPAAGDVIATITAWRPQRPGLTAAGESTWMDLGNLRLVTNIPNAPAIEGQGGGAGPGLCSPNSYVGVDANMQLVSDGLQDLRGDRTASTSNTFTYAINFSTCLTEAAISWDAGEAMTVPIQMMNNYGDNAAQNICFVRATE